MWTSPDLNVYKPNVYVLMPFDDRNPPKYKKHYPDATEVVKEAFETAFLETDYRVLERGKLDKIIDEMQLSMSGLTEEQGINLGKMLNAEAVIYGTVTTFYRGSFLGSYTTVSFSVKAVHVESGVIIWKGNHTNETKFDYDYDPAALAHKVAKEIVQELIAKGHIR